MAMHASSMAIMTAGVMPCMRSIERIIVLHMSAQFIQAGAQSISCVEQTVHACSHAAHASRHACIMSMSIAGMPSIDDISSDIAFIIIASIGSQLSVGDGPSDLRLECARRRPPACRHGIAPRHAATGSRRLDRVMSHGIHTRRPLARLAAAATALLAALVLVFVASPAWAHDELIGSDPAAGAQVDALPAELTMTFSGVLLDEPGATEVVVTDAAGTDLTASDPVLDGTRLTQPLQGDASGEVTVIWRVVSSDGHPISDQFSFTVGDGTAVAPTGAAPSPTETAPADDDEGVSPAVWIGVGVAIFASLIGVFAVSSSANRRRRED